MSKTTDLIKELREGLYKDMENLLSRAAATIKSLVGQLADRNWLIDGLRDQQAMGEKW